MTDTTADPPSTSTVNLVRSSHPWTQADSAAGFVLRYLVPVRRQLIDVLGTPAAADDALKLLLGHLVSVGFGDHRQGRLRDFLVRALRSAAKTRANEKPGAASPDLSGVTPESKRWLGYWRDGLLERAWRALERHEHGGDDPPYYTLLHAATGQPSATPEMLAVSVREEIGTDLDSTQVPEMLRHARTLFAQFIADEVAETLEDPSKEDVKREIVQLGLAKAFAGMQV